MWIVWAYILFAIVIPVLIVIADYIEMYLKDKRRGR